MKIYNKESFIWGALLTVLVLWLLGLGFTRGFDLKRLVLIGLGLFLGGGLILRSLSRQMARQDKLDALDERNILIKLRSRSTAFSWAEGLSAALMFLSIFGMAIDETLFTPMVVAFGLMFWSMLLLELGTLVYYQRKL